MTRVKPLPMSDRAQHDLLTWGAMVLPIVVLWLFKWKPWSAVLGGVVHWGLSVCVLIVRNRFDASGGPAGFYIILGGPFGFLYCLLLIAMRQSCIEFIALVRRGVWSYRWAGKSGVKGRKRLLQLWRDLNQSRIIPPVLRESDAKAGAGTGPAGIRGGTPS